jgi:small-conductance mechanosensitive channel
VRQITLDAVSGIEYQEDLSMFFVEFGDSSVNLSVRMWIGSTEQSIYNKVGRLLSIKACDANDIMIPFPIRTLLGLKEEQH